MRCLTSQHWPDTLRVALKASSYSEAVCVSYIPVVPITTTQLAAPPGVSHKVQVPLWSIKLSHCEYFQGASEASQVENL